jgi:hypothetical protein
MLSRMVVVECGFNVAGLSVCVSCVACDVVGSCFPKVSWEISLNRSIKRLIDQSIDRSILVQAVHASALQCLPQHAHRRVKGGREL